MTLLGQDLRVRINHRRLMDAARGHGRFTTIAGAIVLHAAAAGLLLLGQRSVEPSQPAPGAVAVQLVGRPAAVGAAPTEAAAPARERLKDLLERLASPSTSEQPTSPTEKPAQSSLEDLFRRSEARGSTQTKADAETAGAGAGDGDVIMDDPYAQASLARGQAVGAASRQIEAQAGPCWKGPRPPGPIKVELRLGFLGELEGRPQIRRSPFAPEGAEQRQAEQQALSAVVACAPYRLLRASNGSRTYQVEFR